MSRSFVKKRPPELDKIRIQFYSHAKCRGCQEYVPIHHYISNDSVVYRQQEYGQTVLYRKCGHCREVSTNWTTDSITNNPLDNDMHDVDNSTSDSDNEQKCDECDRLHRSIHLHITQHVKKEGQEDDDPEIVHEFCHGQVQPYKLPERARLKKSPPSDLHYKTIYVYNKAKCHGCQQYRLITDFLKTREVIFKNKIYPHPQIFRTCDNCRQESRNDYICNPLKKIVEHATDEEEDD